MRLRVGHDNLNVLNNNILKKQLKHRNYERRSVEYSTGYYASEVERQDEAARIQASIQKPSSKQLDSEA